VLNPVNLTLALKNLNGGTMNTCPSCGKEISAVSDFCKHCGNKLTKVKKPALLYISIIVLVIQGWFGVGMYLLLADTFFIRIEFAISILQVLGTLEFIFIIFCAIKFYTLKRMAIKIYYIWFTYKSCIVIITGLGYAIDSSQQILEIAPIVLLFLIFNAIILFSIPKYDKLFT
jgi:uncharacterized protein (DUF983 family)